MNTAIMTTIEEVENLIRETRAAEAAKQRDFAKAIDVAKTAKVLIERIESALKNAKNGSNRYVYSDNLGNLCMSNALSDGRSYYLVTPNCRISFHKWLPMEKRFVKERVQLVDGKLIYPQRKNEKRID